MLSSLHHALVDDGEISFVTMYDGDTIESQFIVFRSAYDADFEQYCQHVQQRSIEALHRSRNSLFRIYSLAVAKGANMQEPRAVDIRFEVTDALTFLWRHQAHALKLSHDKHHRKNVLKTFQSSTPVSGTSAPAAVAPSVLPSP